MKGKVAHSLQPSHIQVAIKSCILANEGTETSPRIPIAAYNRSLSSPGLRLPRYYCQVHVSGAIDF